MAKVLKDLVAKTGEYTNGSGETKARWLNVGKLLENDDGGMFMLLSRTFNPAGMVNPENKDSIILSCFDPSDGGQREQKAPPKNDENPLDDLDDEIPF